MMRVLGYVLNALPLCPSDKVPDRGVRTLLHLKRAMSTQRTFGANRAYGAIQCVSEIRSAAVAFHLLEHQYVGHFFFSCSKVVWKVPAI